MKVLSEQLRARPGVRERFGTAVQFRREELGLTREALAEAAGIRRTGRSAVERLAAALGLTMAELFAAVERM